MKRSIQLLLSLLLIVALVPMASAQASRTWVSGVGDDANPCSRTAPCKTFAGAISKTAAGGEIDALDPGGFGAVTITKAITLDGGGGQVASILVAGTNGVIVSAGAADTVILRNLSINGIRGTPTGGLNGVRFLSGKQLLVEHCTIFGFLQNGLDVEPSTASAQVIVSNSTFNNNSSASNTSAGIFVQAAGVTVSLENVRLAQNNFGLHVRNGTASVRHSTLSANSVNGIRADSLGTVRVNVDSSLISDSVTGTGIFAHIASAIVTLSNSSVTANATGLSALSGAAINSFGNNRLFGNTTTDGAPTNTLTQQ